jgi:hypothetical protein
MKKRDITLERKIGICVLGLLVFLAISCSQDVLAITTQDLLGMPDAAATPTNNVQLSVNASNSADANKIYYSVTTPSATVLATPVTLGWTEKAVFSGENPDIKITVKSLLPGDLIIKADFLMATTPGAVFYTHTTPGAAEVLNVGTTSGGAFSVASYWLKYDNAGEFGDNPVVKMLGSGHVSETTSGGAINRVIVEPGLLSSLVLKTFPATTPTAGTTIVLYGLTSGFKSSAHIIFTAVLVNNASATNPQVLGVDVQSIFFNYIPMPSTTWNQTRGADVNTPIWLDLIQAWDHRIITYTTGY